MKIKTIIAMIVALMASQTALADWEIIDQKDPFSDAWLVELGTFGPYIAPSNGTPRSPYQDLKAAMFFTCKREAYKNSRRFDWGVVFSSPANIRFTTKRILGHTSRTTYASMKIGDQKTNTYKMYARGEHGVKHPLWYSNHDEEFEFPLEVFLKEHKLLFGVNWFQNGRIIWEFPLSVKMKGTIAEMAEGCGAGEVIWDYLYS